MMTETLPPGADEIAALSAYETELKANGGSGILALMRTDKDFAAYLQRLLDETR